MARIEIVDGTLHVSVPYYPAFTDDARALGGRWDPVARAWQFDSRDRARVEALVARHYGTPGEPTVTVTLAVTHRAPNPLYGFGRLLAKREFRDSPIKLGEGVITLSERFPRSAGSASRPRLLDLGEEVLLEIKDVPASLASRPPQGCRVVAVVGAEDNAALLAERDRLLARLAEIERILAGRAHITQGGESK